mgnify:CR=1 FL=1
MKSRKNYFLIIPLAGLALLQQVSGIVVSAFIGSDTGDFILFDPVDPTNSSTYFSIEVSGLPAGGSYNALAYDAGRNRLVFNQVNASSTHQWWAIEVNGLTAQTPSVVAMDLGIAPFTGSTGIFDAAGYNPSNGKLYVNHPSGTSDEIYTVNFDASGNVSGYTLEGRIAGEGFPNSASYGDIVFDSQGRMFASFRNENGVTVVQELDPDNDFSVLKFNNNLDIGTGFLGGLTVDGDDNLYGFQTNADRYYRIAQDGSLTLTRIGNSEIFNQFGDMSASFSVPIPEPSASVLLMMGFVSCSGMRRRRAR